MDLDLDAIMDAAAPWDFTVTTGGRQYPTRRPAVGELAAFSSAGERPDRLVDVVRGLFTGDPPDVAGWGIDRLLAFVAAYVAYFNRVNGGKTSADVTAAAVAAVASAMGPADGGSSPLPS